ncbi:hypothetical protein VPH35_088592 [Triticum aestivum]
MVRCKKYLFGDNGGRVILLGEVVVPEKVKLVNHKAIVNSFSYYTALELYRNEVFDTSTHKHSASSFTSSGGRLAAPRTGTPSTDSSPTSVRWPSAWHLHSRRHPRSPTSG